MTRKGIDSGAAKKRKRPQGVVVTYSPQHHGYRDRHERVTRTEIGNRLAALTYRVIEAADHGLSEETWQEAYTTLLVNWATEMVFGARQGSRIPDGSVKFGK